MIKTTRSLNEMINSVNLNENNSEENQSNEENDSDLESGTDAIENESANNEAHFSQIVRELTHNLTIQNDYVALINEIRCCAHTLQLAIHDALEQSNARRILGRAREICKSLRNQVINTEFKRISPSTILPPLDITTRWCSQYMMVIFLFLFNFF